MQPRELENLAARHVPGGGELKISALRNGLVNETYRVQRDGICYAMRVAVLSPLDLGIDRVWEWRVLEHAAAADLAPAVEYCDPQRGILVARWVAGRTWTQAEVRSEANIARAAELMRRIHALPMPAPARVMSPVKWIEYYSAAVGQRVPREPGTLAAARALALRAAAAMRLTALEALPGDAPVLCHGDLHVLNLIERGHSLVLIDWEYAHASDALWDLAGWSANNDFDDDLERELLARYTGRAPSPEAYLRLRTLAWLYDYVCLLWSELYVSVQRGAGQDDMAPGSVFARAQLLRARLDASK
jgi:thiamine kinase